MSAWYDNSVFYHMYPLGMTGAPKEHHAEAAADRFRQLDETLRSYQKGGQAEAAAAKVPFFKRRRFGRSGKKLRDGK